VYGIHAPNPNRDGYFVANDHRFVQSFVHAAIEQRESAGHSLSGIFHFLRPYRDYNQTTFHLRESFLFALGESLTEKNEIEWRRPRLGAKSGSRKLLLHFDGGWPLKGYPPSLRPALVDLLDRAGFELTVLGSPSSDLSKCRFEKFTSVKRLAELLSESAAMVGVDSFPSHYAIDVGARTIQLFASTHPTNSHQPNSVNHLTLHRDLPCVPCLNTRQCPLNQSPECRAAASPVDILNALERMLAEPNQGKPIREERI
jgi:hypothetical protein